MNDGISESRFNMWRTIFALAHADHTVSKEEHKFMRQALETVSFNDSQRAVLEEDIQYPEDVATHFEKITEETDISDFFHFANMMVWCDGNYDVREENILTELNRAHFKQVDLNELIGELHNRYDDGRREQMIEEMKSKEKKGLGSALAIFLERIGH